MASVTIRPRLLFLCQTLPYPPDGGVWIRTYHILRLLSRAFDITALCFERAAMPGNHAARDIAASRAALRRYAWDHVRSTVFGRVYTTYLYESREFQRRLLDVLSSTPIDIVHADSLDLVRYLPACGDIPIVCVHHDVESALLRRRAEIERNEWRGAYLRHQARLMEDTERDWCGRVALNVAVSDADRSALQRIAPSSRVEIVPNGVDIDEFQPDRTVGEGVAFVGGLHWFPNLDALDFFTADILPHLRAACPNLPARWIGSASVDQRLQYRDTFGLDVTGYVDDVRPFMSQAACHIVPLRAGGGTRLKILNSWAMGKPVVATSIGCEGLEAIDGENILIRDDPKAFAQAIVSVLEDRQLARRLGEGGRARVEQRYSWDVIGEELIRTYLDVANVDSRDSTSLVAAAGAGLGR